MEPKNLAVIDVESEPIDSTEPENDEIWYSAVQIQGLLKLSKAGLQQSISKLVSIYGLDIQTLRRGAARATQYSELALKACKLLNAGKLSELRKLVEATPTASPTSPTSQVSTLTISEYTPVLDRRIAELKQVSTSTSASLNQNVMQLLERIASENQVAQQRDSDLDNAEINAAQNRGAARALAVFQAEQKAQAEVLAQLRAMKLGGAE